MKRQQLCEIAALPWDPRLSHEELLAVAASFRECLGLLEKERQRRRRRERRERREQAEFLEDLDAIVEHMQTQADAGRPGAAEVLAAVIELRRQATTGR